MGNCKAMWKTVNKILRPNSMEQFNFIISTNDGVLTDDQDIANHFKKYFTSIAEKLERNMPLVSEDPLTHVQSQCNSFVCLPTSASEVVSVIHSLKNKGSDLSSIPASAVEVVAEIISPTVADLINLSCGRGIFPDNLKLACTF